MHKLLATHRHRLPSEALRKKIKLCDYLKLAVQCISVYGRTLDSNPKILFCFRFNSRRRGKRYCIFPDSTFTKGEESSYWSECRRFPTSFFFQLAWTKELFHVYGNNGFASVSWSYIYICRPLLPGISPELRNVLIHWQALYWEQFFKRKRHGVRIEILKKIQTIFQLNLCEVFDTMKH